MIDFLAGEPHFLEHMLPIWHALPEDARGTFYIADDARMVATAERRALTATPIYLGPRVKPSWPNSTPVLVASYGDIKKARRQGRSRIAFIEHGIGQSYAGDPRGTRPGLSGSYAGGEDRADVGLNLVPNDHAAGRFRAKYPRTRTEVIGSPHAESVPQRDDSPGPTIAVSFHWNCHIVAETEPALGHYRNALPALSKLGHVIGHQHPKWFGALNRVYARLGIESVEEFDDVCRRADVYICDNSSTLYEFAATGRPVVVLNAPQYRRHINHGLRFWEAASVGVQVSDAGSLNDAVIRALELRPEDVAAREAALDLVYAHRSGAAQRASAVLQEWA